MEFTALSRKAMSLDNRKYDLRMKLLSVAATLTFWSTFLFPRRVRSEKTDKHTLATIRRSLRARYPPVDSGPPSEQMSRMFRSLRHRHMVYT